MRIDVRLNLYVRVCLAAAAAALALAGCNCGGGGVGDDCTTNADCDPGLVCDPLSATCQMSGIDGGTDAAATDGGGGGSDAAGPDGGGGTDSAPGTDSGPVPLQPTGAACTSDTECEGTLTPGDMAGCLPPLFGFPGGYCTNGDCDLAAQDCPGLDAMCFGMPGDTLCLDICDPAAPDCRPGYSCFDTALLGGGTGGPFACLPLCVDDADCDTASGETCDNGAMGTFTCGTPGAAVGDACEDNTDCASGAFCFSEAAIGFPAGYCATSCDPTMMPDPCPAGSTCQNFDPMDPTNGTCLDDCDTGMGTGCRTGYACDNELIFGGMLSGDQCVPGCTSNTDCTVAGYECEVLFGLCQPPIDPAQFGEACDDAADCTGGLCNSEAQSGAPMGMCQDECDPTMSIPGDCPSGAACIDLSGFIGFTLGLCYPTCDPMMPTCRPGYSCASFPLTTTDVCLSDCDASSQCTSGCCELGLFGGACVDPAGAMCL